MIRKGILCLVVDYYEFDRSFLRPGLPSVLPPSRSYKVNQGGAIIITKNALPEALIFAALYFCFSSEILLEDPRLDSDSDR